MSMNLKNLSIALIVFAMLSGMVLATVKADPWPNLPSTSVTMQVVDGTTSYFVTTLSNVPAGYDVSNGVYPGWCVDVRYTIPRAPTTHTVKLYSSLTPPLGLVGAWDMVNYILNHKQGGRADIQAAIWYFIKMQAPTPGYYTGLYYPPSVDTTAMVANALANGVGYVPSPGGILAVICDPSPEATQISIIEIRVPLLGLSPGYWKHNVNVYNGGRGSYSGDPHITPAQLEAYAAYIKTNFYSGFSLAWAQSRFQNNQYKDMWLTIANWFNAAAGRAPYTGD
jgi:hypothetical protein